MKTRYDKIFLFVLFLIGFVATFSYGVYLDQNSEQRILFSNIMEYMSHIPGESQLEKDFLNQNIVKISESIERDHGIASYYPATVVWYIDQLNPYYGNVFWHIYTYLFIFCVGCISLYCFMKDAFQSKKIASFTTLIFFFTPRMFAEIHYNNKDMILLAILFSCFLWGWKLTKKCSFANVIMFAISGAFAFNTKIIGAWFFGIIGLYVLAYYVFTKQFNRSIFGKMCVCILTWFGVYILITPASWTDLIEFFKYIFSYAINFARWNDHILYKGKLIHPTYTGIPHKYLPTMILLTVPVGIILLIFAGAVLLFRDLIKEKFKNFFEKEGYFLVVAFSGFVPLAYAILAQTPVYNGWRHFYFVYSAMIACAGYGVYGLQKMAKQKVTRKILHGCGVVYIGVLIVSIMCNHPQEHSYYNWLAGKDLEDYYELDYWDMSVWQAYNVIYKDAVGEGKVTVSALNAPTMWGLEGNWHALPQEKKEKMLITEEWEQANYLIINTTYANMYSVDNYANIKRSYKLIGDISSYGNITCEIYRYQ